MRRCTMRTMTENRKIKNRTSKTKSQKPNTKTYDSGLSGGEHPTPVRDSTFESIRWPWSPHFDPHFARTEDQGHRISRSRMGSTDLTYIECNGVVTCGVIMRARCAPTRPHDTRPSAGISALDLAHITTHYDTARPQPPGPAPSDATSPAGWSTCTNRVFVVVQSSTCRV